MKQLNKRDVIQNDIAAYIRKVLDTIVYCSIRLGKTRIGLKAIDEGESVLVVYPDKDIKNSWLDELKLFTPLSTNITFVTKASVHKYAGQYFDVLIVDEPQLCQSGKQLIAIKSIKYKKRIGLTGTLNSKTIKTLAEELNWRVGITYTIADAIKDKLVKDYEIFIHFIEMDNVKKMEYEKFKRKFMGTEKEIYEHYSKTMDYFKEKNETGATSQERFLAGLGYKKYMGLRTNYLYNSETLLNATMQKVEEFKDKKMLIYTLRTDIADRLSDFSYHSKNKEVDMLEEFKSAVKGHAAVVNCVRAGVTIRNLNNVLFHTYESNTEIFYQKLGRSLLYEFEGEKSQIHIMCLKETQMEVWIDRACQSLEQEKINYVFKGKTYGKLEWLKVANPGKELYMYNGSVVYFSHLEGEGVFERAQYRFLENPIKSYTLSKTKLTQI